MYIHFATCDRARALGFIRSVYPSRTIDDTQESAGPVLDYVERDVIRIQDPMMHGKTIEVLPGNNWSEALRGDVIKACAALATGNSGAK